MYCYEMKGEAKVTRTLRIKRMERSMHIFLELFTFFVLGYTNYEKKYPYVHEML